MWELSRKTYISIYKVVLLKVSLKRRTDKWIDIMIFSRNQRHTVFFFKVFFRKIYTTGSLLDWAWRQKPGGISHWYKKLLKRKDSLSLSYSFDIQMVVITIYYILTHVNVFSPKTFVVVGVYIRTLHIWYNILMQTEHINIILEMEERSSSFLFPIFLKND